MLNLLEVSYKNNGHYSVVIADDYEDLGKQIRELFPNLVRICIISDSEVAKLYLDDVISSIRDCCTDVITHVFPAGEKSKNLATVKACYDDLVAGQFNRRDLIIGLGGGVTGDIAAFVASTYMRGCRFVNLPTTLLAMADSSVGGKCGVDYDDYKNLVGSIYMPDLVYEATYTLNTLPDRQFSSGMAEILKAGLIRDGAFFEWLITNFDSIMDKESQNVSQMLYKAVGIKQYFVTKDPYEENERMMLNFGHTIGHAIEKFFDFQYTHGECVALGIVAAAHISKQRSLLSDEEFYEIRDMLVPFDLPISLDPFEINEVMDNIGHDKKNTDTGLRFILLKKAGRAVIVNDVSKEEIEDALKCLMVEWD